MREAGGRGGGGVRWRGAALESARASEGQGWLLYALLAAILGHVWRLQDLFPLLGKLKFVVVASVLAFGLWLADTDQRRSLATLRHPIAGYALAILALMVLSVPGGVYPGLSFGFIVQDHVKTMLLMILLGAAVRTLRDVEYLVWAQILGAAIYSVFVLTTFEIDIGGRLGDLVYYDANDLGMLLVCTLPLVVYFLRSGAGWGQRLLAAGILPVLIEAIIKTGSRGAFLGFIAVVAFIVIHFRAFPKRLRYGGTAAVLCLLLLTAGDSYWELMRTLLNPQDDYNWAGNAEEGRMEVWKRGIGYMIRYPLGVGANAFPAAEGMVSPLAARQQYGVGLKWSAAHNSFVQIGAELGVVGLVCFLLLLGSAFLFCWRLARTPRSGGEAQATLGEALCATLVGYVVAGFFLSQAYAPYMYATYGIVLGLVKVTRRAGAEALLPRRALPMRGALRPGSRRAPVPVRR